MVGQVRALLREPEIVVATWRAVREHDADATEAEVREALHSFVSLWGELFPAEQARIVQLLVERVDVGLGDSALTLASVVPPAGAGTSATAADADAAGGPDRFPKPAAPEVARLPNMSIPRQPLFLPRRRAIMEENPGRLTRRGTARPDTVSA